MQPCSQESRNTCNVEIRDVEGKKENIRRSAEDGKKMRRNYHVRCTQDCSQPHHELTDLVAHEGCKLSSFYSVGLDFVYSAVHLKEIRAVPSTKS
jgi:hypothetical protein